MPLVFPDEFILKLDVSAGLGCIRGLKTAFKQKSVFARILHID